VLGERFEDDVLGALTIELQKMDVFDAELGKSLSPFLSRDRRETDAEVSGKDQSPNRPTPSTAR
jgi:hypothetical protein